ncbi:hypothetical protein PG997_013672 [Apiospora hydei]|uniref:Uncharacterized protein n=1 Tax=Apiospora hydei TaxID=1337664 RepID=A0ABR1V6V6_9PEZI
MRLSRAKTDQFNNKNVVGFDGLVYQTKKRNCDEATKQNIRRDETIAELARRVRELEAQALDEYDERDETIAELNTTIAGLNARIRELEVELNDTQTANAGLAEERNNLTRARDALQEENRSLMRVNIEQLYTKARLVAYIREASGHLHLEVVETWIRSALKPELVELALALFERMGNPQSDDPQPDNDSSQSSSSSSTASEEWFNESPRRSKRLRHA